MTDMAKFVNRLPILTDLIAKAVADDYIEDAKKNIDKRSFNNASWAATILPTQSNGGLKNSLKKRLIAPHTYQIYSELPYAYIQNNGGNIKVTERMKKAMWAKFYETGIVFYKNMALTKKPFINIPARPFLSSIATAISPETRLSIYNLLKRNL